MKNIYLMGDSQRMRYQPEVTRLLEGEAKVLYPGYVAEVEAGETSVENVNGRWSGFTLNSLAPHLWLKNLPKLDVVHWNNGIWDLVIRFQEDGPFTPIDQYETNVRRIIREMKKLCPVFLIATTTPPRPDVRRHPVSGEVSMTLTNVKRYNEVLWRIAEEQNIPVNDLFSLVMQNRELYLREDDEVHLSEEGVKVCGKQTADFIRKYL